MKKLISTILIAAIFIFSGCSGSSNVNNSTEKNRTVEVTVTQAQDAKPVENKAEPTNEASGSSKPKETPSPTKAPDVHGTTPTTSVKKNDSFTLLITEDKGSKVVLNKKIDIASKKSLMEYLKDETSVIDDGGFIKSINNISSIPASKLTAEQKKAGILGADWFIYVNNKKTSIGAYDIYPKSDDSINLDFKEWTYQDYGP